MKVLFIFLLFSFSKSWGQSIFTNPITATDPSTASPYTNGQTVDANITVSGIARGSGITGSIASNRYAATGWNSASFDANDYFEFTLTPNSGCYINFVSFVYTGQASGTGPTTVAIRSSADGFVANIGTPNIAGTTVSLAAAAYQNINTSITFRFYAWGASAAGGTFSINDFTFNGTTSCTPPCTAPSTTITPTTQTLCAGAVTTISVSSTATIPSYTWQASANGSSGWAAVVSNTPVGASYSGQGTGTLSITAGSTYYYQCLVAENGTCTATSSTSTLVVNTSPTITTQPINKTICSGSNTSFTVAASGSPLTYQWQVNDGTGYANLTNAAPYSNVTTSIVTITNGTSSMNTYSYQCIVSVNTCASATTSAAVLTVNTTPSVPPVPLVPSNPACTTGTFSAMTSTVAGVNWYWETTSAGTSTLLPTTTNYTTASTATVYVKALDASGTCWSTSVNASVAVNSPVTITSGATDKGVCTGINTTMDITGAAATKQWYVSTDNGATFNAVTATAVYTAGINSNALSITNAPVSYNGYQYYCTSSVAGCPTLTSSIGVLTVTQTPSTPPVPSASPNPACGSSTLSTTSSTVAGVTWYWQTTSAGTATTNPTSSSYIAAATATYYVRARADGSSCLSTVSSSIAVTINTPPTITSNPTDKTQCVNTSTTFSASATGTGLTYLWQYNTGSGFVNVPNSAPYSNVTSATMSISTIAGSMNGYQYQCVVSGASPCAAVTSSFATLVITASGTPVTPASSPVTSGIACNAFNLAWSNGSGSNRLVVVKAVSAVAGSPVDGTSYTANAAFGSGSTIAAGEFVVYNGTGNFVYITGLAASTTYYYKIFEFNGCSLNYLSSGTIPSGNITTNVCSSTPGITGVYIDACGGGVGCNTGSPSFNGYEGNNELIWGTTGSYGLDVTNNGPLVHYSSVTQISSYGLNSSAITALNTAVTSCTNTVFVDPNILGYIPANSKFLIANSCICNPVPYDLSGLCNSGPIYVVFGTGPSSNCNTTGGIFGNGTTGAVKNFDIDFNAWGVAINPSYSFTPSSLVSGDGAAITTNPNGGAATGYFNSGCAVPYTILPIDLIDFYATQDGDKNDVIWKVATEKNVSKYIISKSEDGINFKEFIRVSPNNMEDHVNTYLIQDSEPYDGLTYYKLSILENNGKVNNYGIIDIDRTDKDWKTLLYQHDDNLIVEFKKLMPKDAEIGLFDLSGKQLVEKNIDQLQTKINTTNFSAGIYFVKITTPYKTENFKIIISK